MVTVPVAPRHRNRLARLLPWVAAMDAQGGTATAYVCRDFACQLPSASPDALRARLATVRVERAPAHEKPSV